MEMYCSEISLGGGSKTKKESHYNYVLPKMLFVNLACRGTYTLQVKITRMWRQTLTKSSGKEANYHFRGGSRSTPPHTLKVTELLFEKITSRNTKSDIHEFYFLPLAKSEIVTF